tara:strand:- start:178 stop:429 length:252 start_codon:yes stop_codon:yes gene_type:complete
MDKKSISLSLIEYKEIREMMIINNNFRECASCEDCECKFYKSNRGIPSYTNYKCMDCEKSLKQLPLIEKIEKKILSYENKFKI